MEWNIPNTPNTEFRIASLTKQFTAMLIMQLKQGGKLDIQAHIIDYMPYYRKDIGTKITIHHLLTHTSGIPDYTNRPDFFTDIAVHEYSPKDFVMKFCSDSLVSEPGTKYSYCNSEYYILGAIIEAITIVQLRVFFQTMADEKSLYFFLIVKPSQLPFH